MELFQEGIVAFFAAVGIAWAVWTAAQALFLSKRECLEPCVVLIAAKGSAPMLERTVEALLALRFHQQRFARVWIVDCGLNGEGQKMACLLSARHEEVALCARPGAARKKAAE